MSVSKSLSLNDLQSSLEERRSSIKRSGSEETVFTGGSDSSRSSSISSVDSESKAGVARSSSSPPLSAAARPMAGSTCKDFFRVQGDSSTEQHVWTSTTANTFSLRIGPDYARNKNKAPAADSLFDVIGLDIYKSTSRIDNIGSKVDFPTEWTEGYDTGDANIPPIFIVNSQLPEVKMGLPSVFEITDGPGWSIAIYYRLKHSTIALLRGDLQDAPPGVKLFARYCQNAPEQESSPKSPYRGLFKVIPRIDNLEELGLPFLIKQYDSKPMLCVKTGSVFRGTKFVEFDLNVHRFGAVARGLLRILRFDLIKISFGFCLESRDDDEMPEQLLGCISLNRIHLSRAVVWE